MTSDLDFLTKHRDHIMNQQYNSTTSKGYFLALGSSISLAFTGIIIRHLTQTYHMPAMVLAGWRNLFVALILIVIFLVFSPNQLPVARKHWTFFGAYGLILAGFNTLWTLSVAQNGAAVATVLGYTSVSFTALFGKWFLGEKLDWIKLTAIGLSLLGCILVANAWDLAVWNTNPIGVFTGLLSGWGYAGYSLMGRVASQKGLNPWKTLLYAFGAAAAILLMVNCSPVCNYPAKQPPLKIYCGSGLIGLVGGIYFCWRSVRHCWVLGYIMPVWGFCLPVLRISF